LHDTQGRNIEEQRETQNRLKALRMCRPRV
jgi:hypothetical protein